MRLPEILYERMLAHAQAELPNECCGLVAGTIEPPAADGPAVALACALFPLVNEAASPTLYLSEPRSMFEAVRAIDRQGLRIVAVYHSHPTSDPVPSRTDLERNYSEDVVHFIVSLKVKPPLVRGWWLSDTSFREAGWERLGKA